mmetsp:Transcript_6447/g.17964  ORF Transcript_6447/g.17964 Transcript_6447/m.17964 type:complete len:202 (-) Transcript_6447:842-1447(-)
MKGVIFELVPSSLKCLPLTERLLFLTNIRLEPKLATDQPTSELASVATDCIFHLKSLEVIEHQTALLDFNALEKILERTLQLQVRVLLHTIPGSVSTHLPLIRRCAPRRYSRQNTFLRHLHLRLRNLCAPDGPSTVVHRRYLYHVSQLHSIFDTSTRSNAGARTTLLEGILQEHLRFLTIHHPHNWILLIATPLPEGSRGW